MWVIASGAEFMCGLSVRRRPSVAKGRHARDTESDHPGSDLFAELRHGDPEFAVRPGRQRVDEMETQFQRIAEHLADFRTRVVEAAGVEILAADQRDIERIERINRDMKNIIETERKKLSVRIVDALWIAPSRDLSEIAANKSGDLPRMIRYLLRGLGSLEEASEITSFLLFEKTYCQHLQELGFEDAMRQKEQIVRFFTDENTLITGQQEIKP